jgi:hypothetical protein
MMQCRTGDDDALDLQDQVANERYWEKQRDDTTDELETVDKALCAFRGVRAESRIAVLRIYRSIKKQDVLHETLYQLLISKSVLDFRVLYTLNAIATAKKIRTDRVCAEIGKALCPRSASRFRELEPEIVKAIVGMARLY